MMAGPFAAERRAQAGRGRRQAQVVLPPCVRAPVVVRFPEKALMLARRRRRRRRRRAWSEALARRARARGMRRLPPRQRRLRRVGPGPRSWAPAQLQRPHGGHVRVRAHRGSDRAAAAGGHVRHHPRPRELQPNLGRSELPCGRVLVAGGVHGRAECYASDGAVAALRDRLQQGALVAHLRRHAGHFGGDVDGDVIPVRAQGHRRELGAVHFHRARCGAQLPRHQAPNQRRRRRSARCPTVGDARRRCGRPRIRQGAHGGRDAHVHVVTDRHRDGHIPLGRPFRSVQNVTGCHGPCAIALRQHARSTASTSACGQRTVAAGRPGPRRAGGRTPLLSAPRMAPRSTTRSRPS